MFVVLPVVNHNLPFDVNEFVPIGFVAEQPYTLLTSNKLGVNSRGGADRALQEDSRADSTLSPARAAACST